MPPTTTGPAPSSEAALGLDSIHGGVFLRSVEIPEDFAVFGRERAYMAVERAGEDDAGDQRERLRLGWLQRGSRGIARMARGDEPSLSAVFEMQGGQTAAFHGIKRGSTNRPCGIHYGGKRRKQRRTLFGRRWPCPTARLR